MSAAEVLARTRAAGVELLIHDGKLASRGATTPDLRAAIRGNKDALLALLQRTVEPTPAERRLIAVVEQYAGWRPLSLQTLCRALVAQSHPLVVTPVREFCDRLDGITPEQAEVVRRIAEGAVEAALIPERSVDLR